MFLQEVLQVLRKLTLAARSKSMLAVLPLMRKLIVVVRKTLDQAQLRMGLV